MKKMALRRADVCCVCAAPLEVGTWAGWDRETSTVRCLTCLVEPISPRSPHEAPAAAAPPASRVAPPRTSGAGGASAQREHDRRAERRADRIQQAHPRLGGLLLALTSDPVSTRVWAQGAAGERAVAAKLDGLADVIVLHDRSLRRADGRLSSANVDHIAVAPSGVWVIDAKTHQGALEVRRSGGLFGPRVERLYIGGRDRTSLVDGLRTQVAAVTAELTAVGATAEVRGALCFVGTELPWFGSSRIGDVPLLGRRAMGKLLTQTGELPAEDREAVAQYLHERFPHAVR